VSDGWENALTDALAKAVTALEPAVAGLIAWVQRPEVIAAIGELPRAAAFGEAGHEVFVKGNESGQNLDLISQWVHVERVRGGRELLLEAVERARRPGRIRFGQRGKFQRSGNALARPVVLNDESLGTLVWFLRKEVFAARRRRQNERLGATAALARAAQEAPDVARHAHFVPSPQALNLLEAVKPKCSQREYAVAECMLVGGALRPADAAKELGISAVQARQHWFRVNRKIEKHPQLRRLRTSLWTSLHEALAK